MSDCCAYALLFTHTEPTLQIPDAYAAFQGPAASTQHELVSLDDAFSPELAECFHSSAEFRNHLIGCASDVGYLFARGTPYNDVIPDVDEHACQARLGSMLRMHLGGTAPTADEFVGSFSTLCGATFRWGQFTSFEGVAPPPSEHCHRRWLPEQLGALEWHQDWAAADLEHMFGMSRTVMFAFPAAGARSHDDTAHDGVGIFTELVPLTHEFSTESLKKTSGYEGLSTSDADRKAAADLGVSEAHIVRPVYGRGSEILRYKDSEHLHRSPRRTDDPQGRARQDIWRFQ